MGIYVTAMLKNQAQDLRIVIFHGKVYQTRPITVCNIHASAMIQQRFDNR